MNRKVLKNYKKSQRSRLEEVIRRDDTKDHRIHTHHLHTLHPLQILVSL